MSSRQIADPSARACCPTRVPHQPIDPAAAGALARYGGEPVRVLVVPGLRNSGEQHWQSWLQRQYRGVVRVNQRDWQRAELSTWSKRIDETVNRAAAGTRFVAVAHSFGCLALADHLATAQPVGGEPPTAHAGSGTARPRIVAALLAAPADPARFDLTDAIPAIGLGIPSTVVGSETDPWMTVDDARRWASCWGSRFVNLGAAGHINAEAGFGPWPWARFWVDRMIRDEQRRRRIERAHPLEFSFAV